MATEWGVQLNPNSVPDQVQFTKNTMGLDIIRTSIHIKEYEGKDGGVDKFLNNGLRIMLCINWGKVKKDSSGKKIPVPFPTNLNDYKNKLRPILQKYGTQKNVIYVECENEPTTEGFHSGPMSDYLNEFEAFIEVCKELGINNKTVAGAVHTELVWSVMNNQMNDQTSEGKAKTVKQLLDGYKKIDFKYLNFHTSAKGSDYPQSKIPESTEWALEYTGKEQAMMNEWHIEDYNNIDAGKKMTRQIAEGGVQAGFVLSSYISGMGDDKHLNEIKTYNLTPIGDTYKDECHTEQQPPVDENLERLEEIWPIVCEGLNIVKKLDPSVKDCANKVITAGNNLLNDTTTISFNYILTNLDGNPVKDEHGNEINVGHALSRGLLLTNSSEYEDKIFDWAETLHNGSRLMLDKEDVAILKQVVDDSAAMSILLKMRVLEEIKEAIRKDL
jgi:hypothetical protein